jgi:hypothetical protein
MPNTTSYQGLIAAQTYSWPGTDLTCMARVQGKDGSNNLANLAQSDIASIGFAVYDSASGTQLTTGSLAPSSVIFNTLQHGSIWTADAIGFNFLATIPGINFPNGKINYLVIVTFTLAAGGSFEIAFENSTRGYKQ